MNRQPLWLALGCLLLSACAAVVHGPYQDVVLESNPPGATATVTPTSSERGPGFLDTQKQYTVTTPATLRLLRDNTYRVELSKPGYQMATTRVVSSYDWLWGLVSCGPCEAVGQLPTYDMKGQVLPVRFLEAAFYEYPKGAVGAFGKVLRVASPDALLGTSFKLKQANSGYWENWHALGTPTVSATLQPES